MRTISHVSGRCSKIIRFFPSAPTLRWRRSLRATIIIRTWERGAGLTKACGSAACAAAVAAARLKRTGRKVKVTLPGGGLTIDWREKDDHVLMTGPVQFEFEGRFDPAVFTKASVS
jgi:diaminopimelate epimerase